MELYWNAQGEHELPDSAGTAGRDGSPRATDAAQGGTGWLTGREIERAAGMRFAKRRNDYLLGRFTSKRAAAVYLELADSHASLARLEVVNASDGAPELHLDGAVAPVAISLTDRAGWCVCTLAPAALAVGCDLELVEPRSDAFVRDYLTAEEQAGVRRAAEGEPRHEVANLIWCAKESALKVLRTGLRRDTRSVRVELRSDQDPGGWQELSVDLAEGGRLPGWWRRFGRFVLSVVTSLETPQPRALCDPVALERAVPTHAWLAEPLAPFDRSRS